MPESLESYRRLHFYAGNCWRFLSQSWLQREISPEAASSVFGCSFGKSGWHHLRETLEEYDANPEIDYKETTLYRFLKEFRPTSTSFMASTKVTNLTLPLFVYPWGTFRISETESYKDPWQSRFCGPSSDVFVEEEFSRTIGLYKLIRRDGYLPWNYGSTFIGGTILRKENGEERFVVLQGNHRMAVMAHLGHEMIAVRNVPGWLRIVKEVDFHKWPLVVTGCCTPEHALDVFDSFFREDGHHIRSLLLNAYSAEREIREAGDFSSYVRTSS